MYPTFATARRVVPTRRALRVLVTLALCTLVVPGKLAGTGGVAAASRAPELAFVSARAGAAHISLIGVDGSRERRLTPGGFATPAWSPDGRRLAFVRTAGGHSVILVARADGSGARAITRPGAEAGLPAWAPGGRRLAVVIAHAGTRQIATINADGTGLRRLTAPPGFSTAPVWSPDGRQIAFVSHRDHPNPELYVMRGDGGGQTRLTRDGVLLRPGVLHSVWLPGGGRLAYVARVGLAEQAIWVVDASGGTPRRISTGYAPAWSPDGRRLAFVVARVGDAQIYVMDATGKNVRRITPAGTHLLPAWSPDGRWIAFVSIRGSDLALWVMRPDGTGQRRLGPIWGDLSLLPLFAWRPR